MVKCYLATKNYILKQGNFQGELKVKYYSIGLTYLKYIANMNITKIFIAPM